MLETLACLNIARGTTDPEIDSVTWIELCNNIVNRPTRWSLLFIFGFLYWSSIFPIPDTKKYSIVLCPTHPLPHVANWKTPRNLQSMMKHFTCLNPFIDMMFCHFKNWIFLKSGGFVQVSSDLTMPSFCTFCSPAGMKINRFVSLHKLTFLNTSFFSYHIFAEEEVWTSFRE